MNGLLHELEQVRQLSGNGTLSPEAAVAWARNHTESILHARMEWNDDTAAEAYRVQQMRQLIRVVVVQSSETSRMVRGYVSLPSDRVHGGGYRTIDEALAIARQQLVHEALQKLRNFSNGFTHLPELGPLFHQVKALVDGFSIQQKEAG